MGQERDWEPASITLYSTRGHTGIASSDHVYLPLEFSTPSLEFLSAARSALGARWRVEQRSIWFHCTSLDSPPNLPRQGWKVHVSSSMRNATNTLAESCRIFRELGMAFKFVADHRRLLEVNSHVWRPGASKFITAYPIDVEQCKRVLDVLSTTFKDVRGPVVLSDRAYRNSGVTYYRYGSIVPKRTARWDGQKQTDILDGNGMEFVDERKPWFELPPGIEDPFAPTDAYPIDEADSEDPITLNGKYEMISALQQATKGGVFLARAKEDGRDVVVKEARPFTLETNNGQDRRDALTREYEVLRYIENEQIAPKPLELFDHWNHRFVVVEFLAGSTLQHWSVTEGPGVAQTRHSIEHLVQIWIAVTQKLARLRDLGICCGDLSLRNIILCSPTEEREHPEFQVRFLDFESASVASQGGRAVVSVATPGFGSPARRSGHAATDADDRYSLGSIMLAMLLPIQTLVERFPQAG